MSNYVPGKRYRVVAADKYGPPIREMAVGQEVIFHGIQHIADAQIDAPITVMVITFLTGKASRTWSPNSWWRDLELAPIHEDTPEFLAWAEADQEEG